ncbi:tetratricopeptide repeat protein [Pseudomonadota bacterium]
MSLLMDALKKAEQAKAENKPSLATEKPSAGDTADAEELTLEDNAAELGTPELDALESNALDEEAQQSADSAYREESVDNTDPELTPELPPELSPELSPEASSDLSLDEFEPVPQQTNEAQETLSVEALEEPIQQAPPAVKTEVVPTPTPVSKPSTEPPKAKQKTLAEEKPVQPPSAQSQVAAPRVVPSQIGNRKPRRLYWSITFVGLIALAGTGYYFVSELASTRSVVAPVSSWQVGDQPEQGQSQVVPTGVVASNVMSENQDSDDSAKAKNMQALMNESVVTPTPILAPIPAAAQRPKAQAEIPMVPVPQTSSVTKPAKAAVVPKKPLATTPAVASTATRPPLQIQRTQVVSPIQRALNKAYESYQTGDLEKADNLYRRILNKEPNNRDAILGRAIIAQQQNRIQNARALYAHLLNQNPKDSMALTGLISLPKEGGSLNNVSRLKMLLQEEPTAAYLHFALGNEYAAQARWPEAQQAYFEANRYAVNNADYAYNLAVSLERIGQPQAALNYYRTALDAAAGRSVSFDTHIVSQRINVLGDVGDGDGGEVQ